MFWKIISKLSSWLNKRNGTTCDRCKYNNGYSCTNSMDGWASCSGLINKGFSPK